MSNKSTGKEAKLYTMEEVAKHTDPSRSLWIVLDGNVLDVTQFADEHPGGLDVLLSYAGKDATSVFENIHSIKAKQLAKSFIIGKLAHKTNKAEKSNKHR